ncbi:MAG: hypothetical protein V4819_06110 [Verrucomicrobiota bacterium]
MKSQYLLPAATAILGFSIAWLAKPDGTPATTGTKIEDAAAPRTARPDPVSRPSSGDGKRPKDVKASDFPLADQADQGPKSRDEAKMLRLTEALGLSIEQQGEIIALIESVQASASDTVPALEDLTTRGMAVEEGLAKLLTPAQLAKFQEVRERERENQIEGRSQEMLKGAIAEIDLSPAQRDEVLARLRQKSKADLQSIPSAATLLFDKSMLPTGGKELSADGILLLAKMGEQVAVGDAGAAYQKILERQRGELEELLQCFDGILTPGQMGQYQAALAETRELLKAKPRPPEPQPQPAPAPAPAPGPAPVPLPPQQPEEIPDTDEEPKEDTEADVIKATADEDK